ncbi:MAG: tail fiber domain-containing protein, partial [Saprospiraceae bacterium]|nr:tail fiber domain-containing protein [Saprospiraceae bacterium]
WALYANTLGQQNTASGVDALYANTTACQNTAIGVKALSTQSFSPGAAWASGNVAVGYEALFSNQPTSISNGVNNTAVGHSALKANTTGFENTAIGVTAMISNTTGSQNTAIGRQALFYNLQGSDNTACGYKALRNNDYGSYNSANGNYSLHSNIDGYQNVANGYGALYSNTTGDGNTAIGYQTLYSNVGGNINTAIGYDAGTAPGSPNISNTVSVGNNGYYNAASNQAFIGNLSTLWTGGNSTWFTYASDGRVKNNVKEDVKGLDFITRLRPVTYNLDITAMRTITGNAETTDFPEKYDVEKIKQSGFIAQEVELAAIETGYNFSGFTSPKHDNELYTMSYAQFVVPLVKAVQELNEDLKSEVSSLKSEASSMKTQIASLKSDNEILIHRLEKLELLIGAKGNED